MDRLGDLLAPFLEQIGMNRPDAAARITAEWEDLAGEPWAAATRPATLIRGELVLEVRDAPTLSILRYRTGELLERLHRRLGEDSVAVVRLRVARQPF